MEKTQRETGRLDFPEVTVPVTPCWFLLACEVSFSNHSLKAPRSLCWAWPDYIVAWLLPLVCKCVEVTREDWWLWTVRTWVSCSQSCPLQSGADDCVLSKPADGNIAVHRVWDRRRAFLLLSPVNTEYFLHLLAGVFWISRILERGKLRSVWSQYGIPVLLLVYRPR